MCLKQINTLFKYYLGDVELHGSSLHLAIVDECLRTRILIGTRKNRISKLIFHILLLLLCAIQFILDLFPEDVPYVFLNTAQLDDYWSGSAKLLNMCIVMWCIECLLIFYLNFSHYNHQYKRIWMLPFLAISGAVEYSRSVFQFTEKQILNIRKLLKILTFYEYLFSFTALISVVCLISFLILIEKLTIIQSVDRIIKNIPVLTMTYFVCRISYGTNAMFAYLVYFYATWMKNINNEIKNLLQQNHYKNYKEKVKRTVAEYIECRQQLYKHNYYWKYMQGVRFLSSTVLSVLLLYALFFGQLSNILRIFFLLFFINVNSSFILSFLCAQFLDNQVIYISYFHIIFLLLESFSINL